MDNEFQAIIDKLSKARQANQPVLQPKVLIVDAMNTFLRSFAIINHINPKGNHIGGLTGFLKSLGFAIKHTNPTRVIIVFEGAGSTQNKKNLYPDYKGNRKLKRITNFDGFSNQAEESESIENQLLRLVEYLQCLPLDITSIDRTEADDTMAYLATKLSDKNDSADLPPENDDEAEAVVEDKTPADKVLSSGGGIKNHVLPSTVPFGKIALDLNKLFYQNILSIKRHNGNKIIGHKNKRVSDNFVEIILKMFENKPITQSDLKNIKDEQMLYDNLIVQSGLHKLKKIPTNIEQTSEQMKNRLGLITGEIEAGNSNKSLLTELHELLFKMVRVHLISKNAAAAYYKNIKDQFYTL